ncbi:MAG: Gfo/Idh/MocA family oxidoreductase [Clostridiales bacterium]|nr:Gfo/Idh/MocA family oxidoreductase [Clostridiales bacterium]
MIHKLGIIGCGGMAIGHHLNAVRAADVPFEAVAGYDIDPERLKIAAEKGLKTYDDLDKFLASKEFEMVLVATSNNYHCEMTCRALEAGYHVMVEKPAAMNCVELQKMIDTSERCGKLFTVHQNRRWDGDFMRICRCIEEGAVGTPYMIESRIHPANGSGCMYNWRGMTDHGGGMLLDWGVHMLDQLLYLIKSPVKTVYSDIKKLWSEEVDDYSKVIITFENGMTAQMEVTTYAPQPLPRWAVYGNRGAMIMTSDSQPVKIRRIKEETTEVVKVPAYENHAKTFRDQRVHHIQSFEELDGPKVMPEGNWNSVYKNIAGVLDGKEELIVKPSEVMRVFRVIEAAFKSSKEGIVVRF